MTLKKTLRNVKMIDFSCSFSTNSDKLRLINSDAVDFRENLEGKIDYLYYSSLNSGKLRLSNLFSALFQKLLII